MARRVRTGLSAALGLGILAAVALRPRDGGRERRGRLWRPPSPSDSGTTVEVEQMCFAPTILRAPVGSDVTFTNTDPVPHNVLGAHGAWGSYDLLKGKHRSVTYRFTEAGTYPYVCTYHVGMVGTVVVGDGVGGAMTASNAGGPVIPVTEDTPPAELENVASVTTTSAEDPATPWAIAALGAGLVVLAAIAVRRYRRRSLA